jgi:hypothetical protein
MMSPTMGENRRGRQERHGHRGGERKAVLAMGPEGQCCADETTWDQLISLAFEGGDPSEPIPGQSIEAFCATGDG